MFLLLVLQGNTENRQRVVLHIRIDFFLLTYKPKRKSYKLITTQIKQAENKNNDNYTEEIEHDLSGKLFAYS